MFVSSRRDVLRGTGGLAAAVLVGCPKPEPVPVATVADLLTGVPLSEAFLSRVVRSLQAASVQDARVMVQHRTVQHAARDLTEPGFEQTHQVGVVVRVETAEGSFEVASSRVDDDALGALLGKLDIQLVPEVVEGTEAPPSPLRPVPRATGEGVLPAIGVVGVGMGLFVDAVRAATPQSARATWHAVSDDRLTVARDGSVQRSLDVGGRLVARGSFVGAAGLRTVRQVHGPALFEGADPSTEVLEAAAAFVALADTQAEALSPAEQPVSVELNTRVAAEVLVAMGRPDGGSRVRFDGPPKPGATHLHLPPTDSLDGAPLTKGVRVASLAEPPRCLADGSVQLVVSEAQLLSDAGPRPLAAGTRLHLPAGPPVPSGPPLDPPHTLVVDVMNEPVVVSTTVRSVQIHRCTLEGAHVG